MAINDVFQALSDPTRREVLSLLREGDKSAGELAEQFAYAKSTMSGHFRVLRHAGLIVSEKHGTSVVYSLNSSVVEDLVANILQLFDANEGTKE